MRSFFSYQGEKTTARLMLRGFTSRKGRKCDRFDQAWKKSAIGPGNNTSACLSYRNIHDILRSAQMRSSSFRGRYPSKSNERR
jgi:hypothetical protein